MNSALNRPKRSPSPDDDVLGVSKRARQRVYREGLSIHPPRIIHTTPSLPDALFIDPDVAGCLSVLGKSPRTIAGEDDRERCVDISQIHNI